MTIPNVLTINVYNITSRKNNNINKSLVYLNLNSSGCPAFTLCRRIKNNYLQSSLLKYSIFDSQTNRRGCRDGVTRSVADLYGKYWKSSQKTANEPGLGGSAKLDSTGRNEFWLNQLIFPTYFNIVLNLLYSVFLRSPRENVDLVEWFMAPVFGDLHFLTIVKTRNYSAPICLGCYTGICISVQGQT